MNFKYYIFLAFAIFSLKLSAQVDAPFYYMDFNNWSIDHDECESVYGWCEESYASDRVQTVNFDPLFGNSLSIRVQDGDEVNMGGNPNGRTRSEIAINWGEHELYNGMTRYYSFDLFIPDDSTFPEPNGGDYYHIMQWNAQQSGEPDNRPALCDGQRPPILLDYIMPDNETRGTLDVKRDLRLTMGTTYASESPCAFDCTNDPNDKRYKTYIIKDALERGKWNHIVMNIKWSSKWWDTHIYMNVNNKNVVRILDGSPSYQYCYQNPNINLLALDTNGDPPFKMAGVPLLYVDKNAPNKYQPRQQDLIQNRIKIGHYRRNYTTSNTVYIDNFRITHAFPPAQFKTELIPWDCGITLSDVYSYRLEAYELDPVDQYQFEFTEGTNTHTVNRNTRDIYLLTDPLLKANRTYNVRVRGLNSLNGGAGFPFGDICTVTMPSITKLEDQYCGNLNISGTYIHCNPIINASSYDFEVRHGLTNEIISTTNRYVDLQRDLPGFNFNNTYQIRVRAKNSEAPTGFPWGQTCSVKFEDTPYIVGGGDNKIVDKNLEIFPNPASDIITISINNGEIYTLKLFDINGVLLKATSNVSSVDLTNYSSGMYFLHIETDSGMSIKKILKK